MLGKDYKILLGINLRTSPGGPHHFHQQLVTQQWTNQLGEFVVLLKDFPTMHRAVHPSELNTWRSSWIDFARWA